MNRAKALPLALLVAAGAWLSACGLNQAGVEPPRDTIAFPASAIMDNSGQWLFVTNSNADLRYNDGTLMALSLARAEADRVPGTDKAKQCTESAECDAPLSCIEGICTWENCPRVSYPNPRSDQPHFCCWDALDRTILNCDEREYVGPDDDRGNGAGNVRIGSFAAAMVLQHRECQMGACDICNDAVHDDRLLLGVRGDTSLTFIDVEKFPAPMQGMPDPAAAARPPTLTCSSEGGEFQVCDEDHRINKTGSALAAPTAEAMPPEVSLPDEPYALALDDTNGLLYVGHLTGNTSRPFSGGFSLFDVLPLKDAGLDPPRLISPFPTPFPPNSVGAVGITSLKSYQPIDPATGKPGVTNIYASSRFVPQVAPLGVTAVCPQPAGRTREIAAFPNGAYYSSPLAGSETRGIEFVGDRTFILQRSPPALISFLNPYTPTEVLETCGSPTFLSQYNNGLETRLFVTCSSDGEIYVFDPTVPRLVQTFIVGRGPAGLVFDEAREVAYSVNFGDNGIAVIDLDPDHDTEYRVIQRLGFPRTTPR